MLTSQLIKLKICINGIYLQVMYYLLLVGHRLCITDIHKLAYSTTHNSMSKLVHYLDGNDNRIW